MPSNFGLKQVTYEHNGTRFRPVCTLNASSSHVPVWRPYGNATDLTTGASPDFTPTGGAGTGDFFICSWALTGITMASSGLTGTAPEFEDCVNLADCAQLFDNNGGLTTLQSNTFTNTAVTTLVQAFYRTSITAFPSGLFRGLTTLTTVESLTGPTNRGPFLTTLTSIPDDLFDGCSGLTTTYRAFRFCSALTTPPGPYFFRGCTSLTTTAEMFDNCAFSGELPNELYRGCTSLENATRTFGNSGISGKLKWNLFSDCPALQRARSFLIGCSITAVDDRLFESTPVLWDCGFFLSENALLEAPRNLFRNKTSLQDIANFYSGNSGITELVPGSLDGATGLRVITSLYNGTSITSIPENLFDDLSDLISMGSCFKGTAITSIPAGLFTDAATNNPALNTPAVSRPDGSYSYSTPAFTGLFADCTSLTEIPADLFDGAFPVMRANTPTGTLTGFQRLFEGCTALTTVPSDLFDMFEDESTFIAANGIIPVDVTSLFKDCSAITSAVPDVWTGRNYQNQEFFTNPGTSIDNQPPYLNCTNASNYASIPADWK